MINASLQKLVFIPQKPRIQTSHPTILKNNAGTSSNSKNNEHCFFDFFCTIPSTMAFPANGIFHWKQPANGKCRFPWKIPPDIHSLPPRHRKERPRTTSHSLCDVVRGRSLHSSTQHTKPPPPQLYSCHRALQKMAPRLMHQHLHKRHRVLPKCHLVIQPYPPQETTLSSLTLPKEAPPGPPKNSPPGRGKTLKTSPPGRGLTPKNSPIPPC